MATKKDNERTFAGLFNDGEETPEGLIVKVMRGQTNITRKGKEQRISKEMVAAAMALLPYRLPRLNSIDAQVRNVEMSHEEWLESMKDGSDEQEDNTD